VWRAEFNRHPAEVFFPCFAPAALKWLTCAACVVGRLSRPSALNIGLSRLSPKTDVTHLRLVKLFRFAQRSVWQKHEVNAVTPL
jgi:hypothetical protein